MIGGTGPRRRAHAIGVDLGGTHVRAALVDAHGSILASRRARTDRENGPDAIIAQIGHLIDIVRDENAVAIGVGVPGSFENGVVLGIPALPGWRKIALASRITEHASLPCVLENDATAAVVGEWRAGAGQGCDHFVYITVSTGIGAGVVIDRRVLRGARGLAGEIGHTRITDASDPCSCGRLGCWEAVASGTALGRRARRAAEANPSGLIASLAGSAPTSAEHVGQAARRGDLAALALLKEEARWLGLGFVNAVHLYAPERIVVGGGLASLLDLMIVDIEAVMRERLLPGFVYAPAMPAALGDDAGVVGAALQAGSDA